MVTLVAATANLALMEHLLEHKMLVTARYPAGGGGVLVSLCLFNSIEDVDRLLNVADRLLCRHCLFSG
jgi:hypothetical protein